MMSNIKIIVSFLFLPFYLFSQTDISPSKIVADTVMAESIVSSSLQSYFVEFETRDTGRWETVNHDFGLTDSELKKINIDWRCDVYFSDSSIYGEPQEINRQYTTGYSSFSNNSLRVYVPDSTGTFANARRCHLYLTRIKN